MADTSITSSVFSFPLKRRTLNIGRDPSCDICIKGIGVSRFHALLYIDEKEIYIEDNAAPWGMLVNDRSVRRALVTTGATFTIGVNRFSVIIANGIVTLKRIDEPFSPATDNEPCVEAALLEAVSIGRDTANRLHLTHPLVSRFHASVRKTGENSYVIDDHRSTNGTFVNGKRVRRAVISDGDIVHIGPYRFFCSKGTFRQAQDFNRIKLEAFNVNVNKNNRTLLDDVSLSIEPGEFVAILGPSGAGKTTLARTLMGQVPLHTGTILYNGLPIKTFFAAFNSAIGFVTQANLLRMELTVRETFSEQSLLRLPKDSIAAERYERIREVMELLDLTATADCRVGTLSGGEAKRLHFGIELLSSPTIIFLDEPFAGLDPGLIQKLMTLFRKICDKGHTLLLTTHTLEQIHSCDRILFMSDGKVVFSGTPSEIMLHYGITSLSEVYEKQREEARRPGTIPSKQQGGETHAQQLQPLAPRGLYRPKSISLLRQVWILMLRYFKISLRDLRSLMLMALQAPLIALVLMFTYTSRRDLFPVSFYFCLTLSTVWMGGMNSIREIAREWHVIEREFRIGVSPLAYTASKIVVFSAWSVVQAIIFGWCVAFFFKGFHLSFSVVFLLSAACISGTILGLCISVFSKNVNMAISWLPIIFIPQIFFSGILMPFDEMSLTGRIASHCTVTRPVFSMLKKLCLLDQSLWRCNEWNALFFLCSGLIILMVVGMRFRRFTTE